VLCLAYYVMKWLSLTLLNLRRLWLSRIEIFFLFVCCFFFNSNWAGVFVKLKLKPPFKNPGSATASSRFMANIHLHFCSLFFGKVWNDSSGFLFHLLLQSGTQQWSWAGIAQHLICPADQSPRQYFAVAPFRTHAANMKFINCKISLKLRNRNGRNRSALPELW